MRAALELIASGAMTPWIQWGYQLRRRAGLAAVGALVLLGALLFGTNTGGLRDRLLVNVVEAAPLKLAVLPLEDVSGDAGREYFAACMHDALITDLARINALRVTARASAMRYSGTQKSIAEIAKELGVDAALTGSLARSGDRVRITAQLIDGATENHLWTQRYDRTMREVLSLQNEIGPPSHGKCA